MRRSYGVFLSYNSVDREEVESLARRLREDGAEPFLDKWYLEPGDPWQEGLEKALSASDSCAVCIGSGRIGPWQNEELRAALDRRVIDARFRVIPVLLPGADGPVSSELPSFLQRLQWVDFLSGIDNEDEYGRLLGVIRKARSEDAPPSVQPAAVGTDESSTEPARRLALLFKRFAAEDRRIAELLERQLSEAGYQVFVDQHAAFDVDWAKDVAFEIGRAETVIVLLSAASVTSEMLAYEVEVARRAAQERGGTPRFVPIRLAFHGPLPAELGGDLDPHRPLLWEGTEDDSRLLREVMEALREPHRALIERSSLESIGGAMPLDSEFYIVRPTDDEFLTAVGRRDAIVLLKGARQMGKTSLLARGLEHARGEDVSVVSTDFQKLASEELASQERFLQALGEILADQLDLEVAPRDQWRQGRSPNFNFERFLRREILTKIPRHLLWAMDEVDRLFITDFGTEIFALFRTWHNERALNPTGPWSKLTLAIAYATEAHLFINDPHQSPFNVGTRLTLQDFTLEQTAELNRRYGSPLRDPTEIERMQRLLGGHPYLLRHSLNEVISRGLTLDEIESSSGADEGALGDHLRRMLVLLAREPELSEAARTVLSGEPCPDFDSFYRLRSAGVLTGDSRAEARPRCELYATYLREHLL